MDGTFGVQCLAGRACMGLSAAPFTLCLSFAYAQQGGNTLCASSRFCCETGLTLESSHAAFSKYRLHLPLQILMFESTCRYLPFGPVPSSRAVVFVAVSLSGFFRTAYVLLALHCARLPAMENVPRCLTLSTSPCTLLCVSGGGAHVCVRLFTLAGVFPFCMSWRRRCRTHTRKGRVYVSCSL